MIATKLFGIHIIDKNSCLDEKNPHICIGWSHLGDLTKIKDEEELRSLYIKICPDDKSRQAGQNIGQISRFLFKTKKGDYVIFRNNRTIHIGEIVSDYYYKTDFENQDKDYCNNRDVKWIAHFPTEVLSKKASHSLASGMSYFSMDKYKDEINKLLEGESNMKITRQDDFKNWLSKCKKPDGEKYSVHYVQLCVRTISNMQKYFDISPYNSIMEICDVNELESIIEKIKISDNFEKLNDKNGNGVLASSLNLYLKFIKGFHKGIKEGSVNYAQQNNVAEKINKPYNRIVFGAPGTGKSYLLNQEKEDFDHFERVTFHPEYTYSDFVGVYKPTMKDDNIIYSFVAGPFLRVLKCALENPDKNYLLLIEEINRANMAGVFGDVFQLLDRDENGESVYSINVSDDIKNYLVSKLGGEPEQYNELKIPSNMYIWATMNSADQGVYPMDTAFKRRWTFEYISINANDSEIKDIECGGKLNGIKWNDLRKAINEKLFSISNVSEDKCLGPFFLSESDLQSDKFDEIFKSKVLMYLFEDVVKQRTSQLFFKGTNSFSEICEQYNSKGIEVFCNDIIASRFLKQQDTTTENAEDESQENN